MNCSKIDVQASMLGSPAKIERSPLVNRSESGRIGGGKKRNRVGSCPAVETCDLNACPSEKSKSDFVIGGCLLGLKIGGGHRFNFDCQGHDISAGGNCFSGFNSGLWDSNASVDRMDCIVQSTCWQDFNHRELLKLYQKNVSGVGFDQKVLNLIDEVLKIQSVAMKQTHFIQLKPVDF